MDRDVKSLVRDPVFAQFRFVGVETNDTSKILSGDIEEFFIDDLGLNVTWKLVTKYFVADASK